jgi:hydrogenase expression/formation protein HypE
MAFGAGGRAMAQLIEELFLRLLDNPWLRAMNDQASVELAAGRVVVSTDAHVVSPLFFPGGDIGSLSVNGTINDVAMGGARPLYLTASFILEEGFPLSDLVRIVESMARATRRAGVPVVAIPRWWRKERGTASSSAPRASGWCRRESTSPPTAPGPGTKCW